MKTVAASLQGLDENLRSIPGHESKDLGRVHADAAVRHVLALPREFPTSIGEPPTIELHGRLGRKLVLSRRAPGRVLHLTVTEGETDLPLDEMQAVYRVRAFVEHWGEETDLTDEIRLPPELRAQIAGREDVLDEERRRKVEAGPKARSFTRRPYRAPALVVLIAGAAFSASSGVAMGADTLSLGVTLAPAALGLLVGLFLLSRTYTLTVDLDAGLVTERSSGEARELARLGAIRWADLELDGEEVHGSVRVVAALEDGEELAVGSCAWPVAEALAIAQAINDAIMLPEAHRKLLVYHRRGLTK